MQWTDSWELCKRHIEDCFWCRQTEGKQKGRARACLCMLKHSVKWSREATEPMVSVKMGPYDVTCNLCRYMYINYTVLYMHTFMDIH